MRKPNAQQGRYPVPLDISEVQLRIYVDDGYTGTNFDRPAFQRMYQDAVDAKVNVV